MSDRCTYWLYLQEERIARRRARNYEWMRELYNVVADLVHPGNLGPLPPSPEALKYKALQTGLVTSGELFDHDA